MKKNKAKVRRRISPDGFFILSFLAVGMVWPINEALRTVQQHRLAPGEGIIVDGSFAGSPAESSITLDSQPDESELPAETAAADDVRKAGIDLSLGGSSTPANCVLIQMEQTDLHNGSLLQLDSEHEFTGTAAGLTTFAEKNESYRLKNMDLEVKPVVVEAMNKMAAAYESVTGRADLMIYSTTSAYGVEGSLYPDALPDRGTGLCVDICILNDDGTISKISEPYAWLEENAYQYGFVRSYTEADADTSGIPANYYHYRYVGKVHAGILHEQGLSLNAYIEMLRSHTLSDPLYYTDGSSSYTVYYVPAELGQTNVPVPLNTNYEVSGNNTDGFIVEAEGNIG